MPKPPREETSTAPPLTAELARDNQDLYLERLLNLTAENTTYTIQALNTCLDNDWISGLRIDPDMKEGLTLGSEITIGAIPWAEPLRSKTFYDPEFFQDDLEKVYILNHETTHVWLENHLRDPDSFDLRGLLGAFQRANRDYGKGFSKLSQLDFYREQEKEGNYDPGAIRGLEDLTELAAMFLHDPDRLKQHLEFLVQRRHERGRKKYNLASISPEVAEEINRVIKCDTERLLGRTIEA